MTRRAPAASGWDRAAGSRCRLLFMGVGPHPHAFSLNWRRALSAPAHRGRLRAVCGAPPSMLLPELPLSPRHSRYARCFGNGTASCRGCAEARADGRVTRRAPAASGWNRAAGSDAFPPARPGLPIDAGAGHGDRRRSGVRSKRERTEARFPGASPRNERDSPRLRTAARSRLQGHRVGVMVCVDCSSWRWGPTPNASP